MKKPFLYASGAALYIVFIVSILQITNVFFKPVEGTLIIPMTMLSLFVLSASIMGYFFLSEPVSLLVEGKKGEAIIFFGKIVGAFACYVAFFAIILFIYSSLS
jgi:hypothetical protein